MSRRRGQRPGIAGSPESEIDPALPELQAFTAGRPDRDLTGWERSGRDRIQIREEPDLGEDLEEEPAPLDGEEREKEARLQDLIDTLLVHLGMTHWQVMGHFHPVNSEFRALIRIDRYFRQATVYLVHDEAEADWDLAVCHELVHLILDPLSTFVEQCIHHVDSVREAALLRRQIVELEEPLVNRLTEIIIGRPWPQTKNQELDG